MKGEHGSALADSFLRSALATDSPIMPLHALPCWLDRQRAAQQLEVQRIPLKALDQWHFTEEPLSLRHSSGKFFTVEGVRVETDFGPVPVWDQPIINQPEIGILGLISRNFDGIRHFLMQAKIEPGNINGIQLSPTDQSTRSNYTRVHGGRLPSYNDYFARPGRARILVDRLLGEQGSRFLRKRNRNMVIELDEEITQREGFCWLTLGQIKRLLRQDNLVNMTARSVISCLPLAGASARPLAATTAACGRNSFARDLLLSLGARQGGLHDENHIVSWIQGLRARYNVRLERRGLDKLDGWSMSDDEIRHESGRHFAVIAVRVEANGREVARWSQPLLEHSGAGLNGFLLKRIDGILHFLVRACLFPGNGELFEFGSTTSRANAEAHFGTPAAPAFLDLFYKPPAAWVRFAATQSEEGGRFHHYQNRYVILELPPDMPLDLPENYCWMTLSQINNFLQHGYVNIEARNLLACLDFSDHD